MPSNGLRHDVAMVLKWARRGSGVVGTIAPIETKKLFPHQSPALSQVGIQELDMERENLKKALNLGRLSQIGIVVHDLQKSIKNYEEVIGIGPFATIEFKPEKSFVKGRRGEVYFRIGIAPLTTEMSLELLEVIDGEPYHKDFLEKHGEGVQHLGFFTDDYDGVLKRAEKIGIPVLMSAETDVPGMGHVRAAYLDTSEKIGVLVEIIEVKQSK